MLPTNDAERCHENFTGLCEFPPEGSDLVCTAYTCNSIHYTNLIVHILIETSTSMRQKLNVA